MIRVLIVRPDQIAELTREAFGAGAIIVIVVASEVVAAYVPSAAFVAVMTQVPARELVSESPLIEQFAVPAVATAYETAPAPEPPLEVSVNG
jgi:hypothetical protein